MRYYSIKIPEAPPQFRRTPDGSIWSSHPFGDKRNDPEAQEIILNIIMSQYTYPTPDSTLVIKGVSWDQINQTADLVGKYIEVYAGMQEGLPLATAQKHTELLFQGVIEKCWGTWEGPDMEIGMTVKSAMQETDDSGSSAPGNSGASSNGNGGSASPQISFVHEMDASRYSHGNRVGFRSLSQAPHAQGVSGGGLSFIGGGPGGASGFDLSGFGVFQDLAGGFFGGGGDGLAAPLNIIHNLLPNMKLADAIHQTLHKVFPQANLNINISPLLKLGYQDAGMYQNMDQYAEYIKQFSQSVLGVRGYRGVQMASHGHTIDIWDDTYHPGAKATLDSRFLVGQPTWVEQRFIHVKVVMRGDLHISDVFYLPKSIGFVNIGAGGANISGSSMQRNQLSFEGYYQIDRIMHTGDYRSPHGQDWVTNYIAHAVGGANDQQDASDNAKDVNSKQDPQNNPSPDNAPVGGSGQLPTFGNPNPNPQNRPFQFGSVVKRSVRRL